MEERLKADVVKETAKFGGLVLVHQELSKISSILNVFQMIRLFLTQWRFPVDGTVVPCWLSADSIQTPKEGWLAWNYVNKIERTLIYWLSHSIPKVSGAKLPPSVFPYSYLSRSVTW